MNNNLVLATLTSCNGLTYSMASYLCVSKDFFQVRALLCNSMILLIASAKCVLLVCMRGKLVFGSSECLSPFDVIIPELAKRESSRCVGSEYQRHIFVDARTVQFQTER